MSAWTPDELAALDAAHELVIAPRADDGSLRRATPIWVVTSGDDVYVRTWYRRTTGWYGQALASSRAHVTVEGLATDVVVEDLGEAGDEAVRAEVDAAYRRTYGGGADRMVGDEAAATTLRLTPVRPTRAAGTGSA